MILCRVDKEIPTLASRLLMKEKHPTLGACEKSIKEEINNRREKGKTKWVRNGISMDYGLVEERRVKTALQPSGDLHTSGTE